MPAATIIVSACNALLSLGLTQSQAISHPHSLTPIRILVPNERLRRASANAKAYLEIEKKPWRIS